jgi:hypothetical protein
MSVCDRSAQYDELVRKYADSTNSYLNFYSLIGVGETGRLRASFYAFMTDFGETFNSSWESQQFFGKTDAFVGFKNTTRTMTLAWTAPAGTIADARENLKNINNLALMLYPAYISLDNSNKMLKKDWRTNPEKYETVGYRGLVGKKVFNLNEASAPLSKPPYVKVEWSSLIRAAKPYPGTRSQDVRALTGYLEGLSMNVSLEAGFFNDGGTLLPKVWTLSCSFNVLHQHELSKVGNNVW